MSYQLNLFDEVIKYGKIGIQVLKQYIKSKLCQNETKHILKTTDAEMKIVTAKKKMNLAKIFFLVGEAILK